MLQAKNVFYMSLAFVDGPIAVVDRLCATGHLPNSHNAPPGVVISATGAGMAATTPATAAAVGGGSVTRRQYLVMRIFGVNELAAGFREGLEELLNNTLAGMALQFLNTVLVRSPRFKLTPGDLAFLRPAHEKPARRVGFLLPAGVHDAQRVSLLIEQNVLLFLNRLNLTPDAASGFDHFPGAGGGRPSARASRNAQTNDGGEAAARSERQALEDTCESCMLFVFRNGPTRRPIANAVMKHVGRGVAVVQVAVHRVVHQPKAAMHEAGALAVCVCVLCVCVCVCVCGCVAVRLCGCVAVWLCGCCMCLVLGTTH